MNHKNHTQKHSHQITDFLPLIIIGAIIIAFTAFKQLQYGFNVHEAMYDFMGSFFVIFGLFKLINVQGFANAYSEYDIIAKRSQLYAYSYPFIELALGIAYLARYQLMIANWITLILMIISSIGVAYALKRKKKIECACLGTVFKLPMTYVTLLENVLMGIMAAIMLIR